MTNEEADFIKDYLQNSFLKYMEKTRTNENSGSLATPRQNEIWWRATLYRKIWSQIVQQQGRQHEIKTEHAE